MSQNLIHASLADADAQEVLAAIDTIEQKLPFLLGLSPDQIRTLVRLGEDNIGFVQDTLRVARLNAGLLPANSPVPGLEADLALWQALLPVAARVTRLKELLDSTLLATRSDCYAVSLDIYASLQRLGDAQGLEELRAQLAKRFRRGTAAGNSPTPPPAAPANG